MNTVRNVEDEKNLTLKSEAQSRLRGSEGMEARWMRIRQRLRQDHGEHAYSNYLRKLTLLGADGDTIVVSAPSPFLRDRIDSNYGERIRSLWMGDDPSVTGVRIVVVSRDGAKPSEQMGQTEQTAEVREVDVKGGSSTEAESGPVAPAVVSAPEGGTDLLTDDLGAQLDPRFTFDNFVVGKPNELAFAAARRVAESDDVTFNPLFLYGGVGLGKTHLMNAIAWEIRVRFPNRRVVYLSAEKFMYQFIRALRFKNTVDFKDQFRNVDVLMIDDVQFIGGKDSTQEEFFHTFNALVDQNRQVVISADKSPNDLEGMEERLRSRLGWGLVADIHPTTYELRLGILQSKAEKLGVEVPVKVLEFLAHKIASNVRELEGAMNRIVAHSTLVGREISMETTREVLHDLLRAHDRRLTIEDIQRQVATHFQVRVADMHSPRRSRSVARPRQVAMYLAKALTTHSLPEIGRAFGGRDHTTVLHAVRKVDALKSEDRQFDEDVEMLKRLLEN